MYSAPSGYPRSSAAIETCAIQSCNRFTAASWRFATSDLIVPISSSAEWEFGANTIIANAVMLVARRGVRFINLLFDHKYKRASSSDVSTNACDMLIQLASAARQ